MEALGNIPAESIGEYAPGGPSPYAAEWERVFGTQENDWDSLSEVPFSGADEAVYMTKNEAESHISNLTETKNKEGLKVLKTLLQEGRIILVSDDDEEPKPKVRVRTRKR